MKIDVFSNGKLLYSVSGPDDFDSNDIAIVSRRLIEKATVSAEGFEDMVREKCMQTNSIQEAYNKAEERHHEIFGHNKYSDYDSFRISRLRRK